MAEKVLVISPVPLFPSHSGNRTRILSICTELQNLGYTLDFFYIGFQHKISSLHEKFFNGTVLNHNIQEKEMLPGRYLLLRILEIINGLKIRAQRQVRKQKYGTDSARFNKSLYDFKNIRKLKLLQKQLSISEGGYKAVVLNYAVYSFYLDLFDENIVKIIDTHDRLSDRYKLYIEGGEEPVAWKSITPDDERKAIRKADIIWAITQKEADYFKKLTEGEKPKVLTVPHLVEFKDVIIDSDSQKKTILAVAGKGKINIAGLNWFFSEVWKEVTAQNPELKLIVAGSICDMKEQLHSVENVTFHGRYDDSEEVYGLTTFCINPIQFGTGLKIKTLEALSFGKEVLTTQTGADGLEQFAGKGLIVKNNPKDWINIILTRFGGAVSEDSFRTELLHRQIDVMYKKTIDQIVASIEEKENRAQR